MKKLSRLAILFAAMVLLSAASLPRQGPLPEAKPIAEGTPAPIPEAVPRPEPAPQRNERDTGEAATPGNVPQPQPKPASSDQASPQATDASPVQGPPRPDAAGDKPKPPGEQTLEEQKLTIEAESVADHSGCTSQLRALGVTFKDAARIDDGNGCGIDKPVIVSEALPGVTVKPEATIRCPAALALARWLKESVVPAAAAALPDRGRLIRINQASAYICRLRNGAGTGKISEHARGNAIDIASFTFEKGDAVAIQSRREDSTLTGAFQRTVSASGCLYFTTVLDPESDAAHETHFHLDVISRKGGFRYCH